VGTEKSLILKLLSRSRVSFSVLNTRTAPSWTLPEAAHLLNRAGFGGTPEEINQLHALGREGAVESLLKADVDSDLFPAPPLTLAPEILAYQKEARAATDDMSKRQLRQQFRRQQYREVASLRDWWLKRCRYTTSPLREKMTLFWHGHFATSILKINLSFLMWQQNETLRAYALGNFHQLAEEISRDPAMMRYLDLDQSVKEKPNENFARELMELFMLGEGVRYTEKDVQESARAFTGYRINRRTLQYTFAPLRFDDTPKEFLGRTGNFKGTDIVNIICAQPECADFMARKIWNFLAGVPPSPALAQKLAKSYLASDYDTSLLLREIFTAPEFYSPTVIRKQVKSPVQWLVQTSRVLNAPLCSSGVNEQAMRQMGQLLFAPPNVKGWEGGTSWINSSTFLLRCNLAGNIIYGGKPGAEGPGMNAVDIDWAQLAPPALRADPVRLVDELSLRFLNASLAKDDRERFIAFAKDQGTDDEALRSLVHLFLSTPEYQLT
jgi:Protein of unknown function (DUF1800)